MMLLLYSAPINTTGAAMLKLEEWMDIKELHRQGYSIRKITEITGRSRNTIRRKFKKKTPASFTPGPRASKLDPFKEYVRRLDVCERNQPRPAPIVAEVCKRSGTSGRCFQLQAWCDPAKRLLRS